MKILKSIFLFFIIILSVSSKLAAKFIPVDQIEVVVYGDEKTELVTASDINRPGIDGSRRTKEDLVFERLMFQDALKFKIVPSEDALDTYLREIQREHNMSQEDLKQIFRQAGYTFEQGCAEFGRIKAVNEVVGFRVFGKLIIPEKEVHAYYEANPETTPIRYCLKHAIAHFPRYASDKEKERVHKKLEELLSEDDDGSKVAWTEPYWLTPDEISDDKKFICDLEVDQVSDFLEVDEGFLVFKLVEKEDEKLVVLEDRYETIVDTLRQPKFAFLFDSYKEDLKGRASFIYF